ncbi:MAG: NADH-quinone oxidoreductase subunit D [Chloroflexi bacterium]|nr:NADH-quinone oxidoreductase subunit D [Chloroflexota bacterium]
MLQTEELMLNMGPQHPSTHGVLRLLLRIDGEVVKDIVPDLGFLHSSFEKLFENRNFQQGIAYTDRMDYLASMNNNECYCRAAERLMEIEAPDRANYIRCIASEMNRLASHLVWVGTFGLDTGALSVFLYCFREREFILNLFEALCGARLTYNFMRIGGVAFDLPEGWSEQCLSFLDYFMDRLHELDELLTGNEIFLRRTEGVGIISGEEAVNWGLSGPMLRGSGVPYDVRRSDPYGVYPNLDFEVVTEDGGDVLSRYFVRMREMRESVKIVRQCLKNIPEGPILGKVGKVIRAKKGEAYAHVESPRGDLGCYMIGDNSDKPYRAKWRAPSFNNLQVISEIGRGYKVADLVVTLGSVDIVLGEVDR